MTLRSEMNETHIAGVSFFFGEEKDATTSNTRLNRE